MRARRDRGRSELRADVCGTAAGDQTDKRDVAALAEACRLGIFRRAHRVSAEQRARRRELRVREQLIRVRTQAINLLRARLRQEATARARVGRRRRCGGTRGWLAVPDTLHQTLTPILALLEHLAEAAARAPGPEPIRSCIG